MGNGDAIYGHAFDNVTVLTKTEVGQPVGYFYGYATNGIFQKCEAYECGIPSRGESWMQFKVGYYLFAILYLMFDVETVFLFPWAVILKDLGVAGLFNILFFMVILVLGLVYAWKKGALEWK